MTNAADPKENRSAVVLPTVVSALLLLSTIAAYWQVKGFDFTNFDDPDYVAQNETVHRGLTLAGLKWAFTTKFMGNWHPLTWMSHMLDCELFGANPGPHHLVNVGFHCLNTVLLLWVLFRYTGALGRSALVAGLFALHPLHVESVAWVAERKDVLSAFFWLLTMWGYLRYVEKRSLSRYLITLLFFGLGLMSKPMLVTLPLVLLLLDYWPLGRARTRMEWRNVLLEKVPLFVLTIVSCAITFSVQKEGGAVGSMEKFSLVTRSGTALVGYLGYIGKTLLPENLAVFYPHPGTWPMWQVGGAALFLGAVSAFALGLARRAPYLIVGWLWFVGTLVPVIGLVQVGEQAYADRYTYIPLIGLFVAIVWGVGEVSDRFRWPEMATRAVGFGSLLVCTMLTYSQVSYWRNSETLFRRALAVTDQNDVAHYNLAQALSVAGRIQEAIPHYEATLQLKPGHSGAHNNLGLTYAFMGQWSAATNHYAQALQANPGNPDTHFNFGVAELRLGNGSNAVVHLQQVLETNAGHASAHNEMANALMRLRRSKEAAVHYREAIRLNRFLAEAHERLAWLLATDVDESIRNGKEAVELAKRACELVGSPRPEFLLTLGAAYAECGDFKRAVEEGEKAEKLARNAGDRAAAESHGAVVAKWRLGKPHRDTE